MHEKPEPWLDQLKLQLATDWTVALARARAKFPQHAAGVLHHTIGPAPPRENSDGLTVWRAASRHAPPHALSIRCDPLKRLAGDTHYVGDPDHELLRTGRFHAQAR